LSSQGRVILKSIVRLQLSAVDSLFLFLSSGNDNDIAKSAQKRLAIVIVYEISSMKG
jgi:hypothetical protein